MFPEPTEWGIRTCLPRLHRKARGKPNLKVRTFLWVRWMCSKQVRGDPYWALALQTTQNRTLPTSGLLKCENLVKCRTQVLGDPHVTSLSSMTMIWTMTPPQNRTFLWDHDHSWQSVSSIGWNSRRYIDETFKHLGNVCVFNIGSICIHGKELLGKFTFHQKYRRSQWNRCLTYLKNW